MSRARRVRHRHLVLKAQHLRAGRKAMQRDRTGHWWYHVPTGFRSAMTRDMARDAFWDRARRGASRLGRSA